MVKRQFCLPLAAPFKATAEGDKYPTPFNLTSVMYHISGTNSFTFEYPHGLNRERARRVRFDEILDIQLSLYEAMMKHELAKKATSD